MTDQVEALTDRLVIDAADIADGDGATAEHPREDGANVTVARGLAAWDRAVVADMWARQDVASAAPASIRRSFVVCC